MSALFVAVVGCVGDGGGAPRPGTYTLRAVSAGAGMPLSVPATLPALGGGGDSVRWLRGTFVLGAGRSWQERWERALVGGGLERERRVSSSRGHYRVVRRQAGEWVLDLYPGRPLPDIVERTAVLRGDTLFHDPLVYTP